MLSRNIFIGLLILCVVIISGFYFLVYNPEQQEQKRIQNELKEIAQKFNKAKRAKNELENLQLTLDKKNEELEKINTRFIDKENLSAVTVSIRNVTRQNNLKLIDFTPLFKAYFADTSSASIKALPFSLTVQGGFLNIGKFIENWQDLSFYMVPDEISVDRVASRSNQLEANITGRLYAWSNDRD